MSNENRPIPPPRTNRRTNTTSGLQRSSASIHSRRISLSNHVYQNSLKNAEEILKQVKKDWPLLASEEFNPVPLALDLIDVSSLGKDFNGFENLLDRFNNAVEEVVNEHYNQFNSTTTIFTGVQNEIGESQSLVHQLKSEMNRCKEILGQQRSDLNILWSKAKQCKEMLRILDKLDEIKKVLEKLEALFRDKYYLTGIRLLLKTLTEIESEELKPIKATDELRRTLFKIKNTLHETLIEEIHNHVYLKIHLNEEFDNLLMFSSKAKFQELISSYLNNDYDEFKLSVDTNNINKHGENTTKLELIEDLTSDPEADSLNFLRTIVVCLKLIGKLPEAIEMIKSRVPVELYQLVDKTINEIEERKEKGDFLLAIQKLNDLNSISNKDNTSDLAMLLELEEDTSNLGNKVEFSLNEYQLSAINPIANEIITAFVSRLYRKFELILGNHRFIMLLIQNIAKDTTLKSPFPDELPKSPNPTNLNKRVSRLKLTKESSVFNYNLKEVWSSMQSEIKSLLYDYISDPQLQNIAATDAISSINEALRGRLNRDLKKPLFKFSEVGNSFKGNNEVNESFTSVEKRLSTHSGSELSKTETQQNQLSRSSSLLSYYSQVETRVARSAGSNYSKKLFSLSNDNEFQIPGIENENINMEFLLNSNQFNNINNYQNHNSTLNINLASIAVDKFSLSSKLATEHRLLISPDIYNISILFPLTVSFFERAQELLHFKNEDYLNFETFLHEFFSSAFLPQMELKAQQHLFMATSGTYAFQIGYKHTSSYGKPLLNCVGELLSLVKNLCTTLKLLPFQREEYIKIIENVLEAFYEKCHSCFKNAVMSNINQSDEDHHASGTILSSTWAQSKELVTLFSSHPYIQKLNQRFGFSQVLLQKAKQAMSSELNDKKNFKRNNIDPELLEKIDKKETEIELNFKLKKSLHTSELLFDIKKLSLLATLSHSLKWFVSEVDEVIGNKENDKQNENNEENNKQTPTLDDNKSIKSISLSEISKGPSTIRSMAEYTNHLDKILNKFNKLSDLCLFTLRVEFRCHTMYYLDLAVREGTYYLNYDQTVTPDSYVTTLNSDLAIYEENLRKLLTEDDLNFIFDRLPTFMSRVLISIDNVQNIRKMSTRGLEKMELNISALQQNLTNMGFNNDLGLNIAKDFYSLYDLDLETFSQRAQNLEQIFTQPEYKALLDLTLETLLFESSNEPDTEVTELILQSYHKQLMELYQLIAQEDQ
ncbi:hypothetical protein K502DRAFT_323305 [Neoconidiobolus thromboides FSU 785]|nr:hypothetical protein K502DRAFT_323305 [Neoconidiobolus thromboides FSU 785]